MKVNLYVSALLFTLILSSTALFAQEIKPALVVKPVAHDVFDLSKVKPIEPGYRDRTWKEGVIPNKEGFLEEFNTPSTFTGPDPVLQDYNSADRTTATIDKNFNGMPNLNGYAPPDTHGDVGESHYMQMVNCTFQIFTKNGVSTY